MRMEVVYGSPGRSPRKLKKRAYRCSVVKADGYNHANCREDRALPSDVNDRDDCLVHVSAFEACARSEEGVHD